MSKAGEVLSSVYDDEARALLVKLTGDSINVDLSGVSVTVRPDPNIAASFDSDNNRINVGLPANLIQDNKLKVNDSQLAEVLTVLRGALQVAFPADLIQSGRLKVETQPISVDVGTRSARPIAAVRDIDENGNVSIKDYVIKQGACIFNQVEVVNV